MIFKAKIMFQAEREKPHPIINRNEATPMHQQHKVSLLPDKKQGEKSHEAAKIVIFSLIVICVTLFLFTWIIRDSLCKLHIKRDNT
ncbi:Hok/Gef family protein [Photorhabdus aballayi]|uniref:Hok/Gef family protein n=1 Tax=Photorhabdus aballayi TaxID=2991723 RepID=UPI0035DCE366